MIADSVRQLNRDAGAALVLFLVLATTPLYVSSIFWLGILIVSMYFAMLASGWNLQIGYTGQTSLAPAAFAMIGAYTDGLLGAYFGLSPWIGILAGGICAGAIGLLLGVTALRLSGPYLALTTLGFSEVMHSVVLNSYDITNGQNGLSVAAIFQSRIANYYLFLVALLVTQIALYALLRSRAGLYLQAIRDDDVAARARGIHVLFWKVMSFTIAAMISGFAGALYGHFALLINPDLGTIFQTGLVITIVVIGGIGSFFGPLIGAIIIYLSTEWLRGFGGYHQVFYALLVILVARFFRTGLWGLVNRSFAARPAATR